MESFKRRVYEVIEVSHEGDASSRAYDILVSVAVIIGLIPLTMKTDNSYTHWIDIITSIIFMGDYLARFWTSDYKMGFKSYKSYIAYIITPLAIFDMLSMLPIVYLIAPGYSRLAVFRYFRLFRMFRVMKLVRYSKTMRTIENVIRRVRRELAAVLALILAYIFVSGMLIFQLEPDQFNTFFDAIYWATISITTIGYGDISPVTPMGRFITMLSALVGVAVIALPSGIITAAYMDEIKRKKTKFEK